MCFGGGGGDGGAAQIAAQQKADEQARQKKIDQGRASIDAAFSQYDDPFFTKFQNDFTAAQNPDIDLQFNKAKDQLAAGLADRGILNSTIAGNAFGDLTRANTKARSDLANEAVDATNQFKNSIQKTKSDLYATNSAAADPGMIANDAEGAAASLVAPRPNPLGDLFGSVLAPFAAYTRASAFSPYTQGTTSFKFAPTSGSGSGTVIG